MISKDRYELLTFKYGRQSSWAIWSDQEDKPKSGMDDLSLFDNEEILKYLNPNIVLVALNLSVNIKFKPWENFHGKNGEVYKLRYALKGTPLWGGYMTDIIKGHVDPSATGMMKYIDDNPQMLFENVRSFEEELNHLGGNNPRLVALGNDVFKLLTNNLGSKYHIKKITHYGYKVSKEIYKRKVWQELDLN